MGKLKWRLLLGTEIAWEGAGGTSPTDGNVLFYLMGVALNRCMCLSVHQMTLNICHLTIWNFTPKEKILNSS